MPVHFVETDEGNVLFRHCCCYNENINCSPHNRHCEKCGWNPAVSKDRLEKFCNEHRIAIPNPIPHRKEEEE